MKTFFDGIFIDGSKHEEIEYPMKLEYYKTIETQENVKAKYGIEIVKTEFMRGTVNIESEKIENITNDQKEIEEILNIFKNNEVTPIGMQDVLNDMLIKL